MRLLSRVVVGQLAEKIEIPDSVRDDLVVACPEILIITPRRGETLWVGRKRPGLRGATTSPSTATSSAGCPVRARHAVRRQRLPGDQEVLKDVEGFDSRADLGRYELPFAGVDREAEMTIANAEFTRRAAVRAATAT
jgi:hypothetical protein